MRTFPHFNSDGPPCPVCGTHEDKETVLIPIYGKQEGNISEAAQVHVQCIEKNWTYFPDADCIAIKASFAAHV